MSLVFLDCETTGLEDWHEVTEVAWSFAEEHPVWSLIVPHTGRRADKTALDMQGYGPRELWAHHNWCSPEDLRQLTESLRDQTICAANIVFDDAKVSTLLGYPGMEKPWHYRRMCFESWAAGYLGMPITASMRDISAGMRRLGSEHPEPDHTAAGDVRAMKEMHGFAMSHPKVYAG